MSIPHHAHDAQPTVRLPRPTQHKADLVAIGQWALASGRGWLVHVIHAAIVREGLRDA